jgi:tetratricopeptide (TPR) repeat protein
MQARDPIQTALELRAQGQIREALNALSVPGDFPADFYILRGDLQLELDQTKKPRAVILQWSPRSRTTAPYAQCNLGLCLRRLERWEQAAEAFQAVLKLDPHRDEVRIDLGDCLLHLNPWKMRCFASIDVGRVLRGGACCSGRRWRSIFCAASIESRSRLRARSDARSESGRGALQFNYDVRRGIDLRKIQRYSRRLLDINPRSGAALEGLALVAIERREHENAARFFARAAELGTETVSAADYAAQREQGDSVIEYRLSREVLDRLNQASRARAARE